MELCKDKSCVLDVCLCDACEVACPKVWCVGGGLEVLILVLLLCFWWLPNVGLGTLFLGVVVKGERGVRGSWPAPTGLAVAGMSWNLRLVVAVGMSWNLRLVVAVVLIVH